MSFYAILYVSRAVHPFTSEELDRLLATARRNNEEHGISGHLVYISHGSSEPGHFVQWIEGEDWRIRDLFYHRILRDERHAIVQRPLEQRTLRRLFPDWTMSFEEAPPGAASLTSALTKILTEAAGIRTSEEPVIEPVEVTGRVFARLTSSSPSDAPSENTSEA